MLFARALLFIRTTKGPGEIDSRLRKILDKFFVRKACKRCVVCYYVCIDQREREKGAMTNTELFRAAHAITKANHVAGESYQVTFGQAGGIVAGGIMIALLLWQAVNLIAFDICQLKGVR